MVGESLFTNRIFIFIIIHSNDFVKFQRVEPSYTSKYGCRLVWQGIDEDDTDIVILNKTELEKLVEILKNFKDAMEFQDMYIIVDDF